MRRSPKSPPLFGLLLSMWILMAIGLVLLFGQQQRIAEELARTVMAQEIKPKPLPASNNEWRASRSKTMPPRPQSVVRGSTILFNPAPSQK